MIFLLTAILITTSCKTGTGNNVEIPDLQKGTSGLKIILKDKETLQAVENSRAQLTFDLQNTGFNDIEEGVLVSSLGKDYAEVSSWQIPQKFRKSDANKVYFENMKGKSLPMPEGEKQILGMVIQAKDIPDTTNKIELKAVLSACYPYKTTLAETVCIDTDPLGTSIAEKTCEVKDLSLSEGQGAPIAITKIKQNIIPADSTDKVKVAFDIYVENKDKGLIINPRRYNQICSGDNIEKEDYNKITLESLKFSDYEYTGDRYSNIDCSPNPLRQSEGKYFTRCILREDSAIPKERFTFETQLMIELSYGYKVTESKDIEILTSMPEIE